MPRFFFDIHDGTFMADDDGVEVTGIDDARKAVWNTLLPMAAERRADGNMACQLRMDAARGTSVVVADRNRLS